MASGSTLRSVSAWLVWLIAAAALGVGELLTLTFELAMFAGGAAVAAVAAAVGAPGAVQGVAFAGVSLAGLWLVRPVATRHRNVPTLRTGAAALVGRRGRTITDVSSRTGGRVRIGGEEWTAAPYDEHLVIPADTVVDVLQIAGATAVVHPVELPLGSSGTEPSP
jgi:membrane protein implicated in regulation of membrane protease activity